MALFSRRPRSAGRASSRDAGSTVHTEAVVVANPDAATLGRLHALRYGAAVALLGESGTIGYDRGDPATSLTGAIPRRPYAGPSAALAAVTRPADLATLRGGATSISAPTPEYSDQASTAGNEFAGWQAALYHRINR